MHIVTAPKDPQRDTLIQGTLDEQGIVVQLDTSNPVHQQMCRLFIWRTYEVWATCLPAVDDAPPLAARDVWLVNVMIDTHTVRGSIRASVVVDMNNIQASIQPLLPYLYHGDEPLATRDGVRTSTPSGVTV